MDITQKIHTFLEEHELTADDLKRGLDVLALDEANEKIRKDAESHQELVGKCFVIRGAKNQYHFPPMNHYLKVLSAQSQNQFCVECLEFDEHPVYWFEFQLHKARYAGDGYLGSFQFQSFYAKSVLVDVVKKAEEITLEEYNQAMQNYTKELIEMQWTPNHCRNCTKLPQDDDWTE